MTVCDRVSESAGLNEGHGDTAASDRWRFDLNRRPATTLHCPSQRGHVRPCTTPRVTQTPLAARHALSIFTLYARRPLILGRRRYSLIYVQQERPTYKAVCEKSGPKQATISLHFPRTFISNTRHGELHTAARLRSWLSCVLRGNTRAMFFAVL